MALLLDTQAMLWWLHGDRKLSKRARTAIEASEGETLVSAASAWEIATKFRLGKLPEAAELVANFPKCLLDNVLFELPISIAHARLAGTLPGTLRDPFDRMLIAQSILESIPLVSNETLFDEHGLVRIW